MEVHKPKKPIHSWRELLGEIGIIVIGVIIALSAEQIADAIRWQHKVADAEVALRDDLGIDLAFATDQLAMKNCVAKYFDRLEAAVRNRDPAELRRLAAMETPFSDSLATQPWRIDSWTAAISSEIPDHISREKLSSYAFAFRMITTQRERQFIIGEHYAEVVAARLIDKPTPEISYAQLAALDKLRLNHNVMVRISANFSGNIAKRLGVEPNRELLASMAGGPSRCEKQLALPT